MERKLLPQHVDCQKSPPGGVAGGGRPIRPSIPDDVNVVHLLICRTVTL